MSTSGSPPKPRLGDWYIVTPGNGATVSLNPGGTVTVTVDDNGAGNPGYLAGIYDQGAPQPQQGACVLLNRVSPMSSRFTGEVPTSVPPYQKNVIVYVLYSYIESKSHSFTIAHSGSGSGGGAVAVAGLGAAVPRTLHAHVSGGRRPGGAGGVYALLYDPTAAAWLSGPEAGPHGLRLRRSETNWELRVNGTVYRPSVVECGPSAPFQIVFEAVDLGAADGGTDRAAVEILLTPG